MQKRNFLKSDKQSSNSLRKKIIIVLAALLLIYFLASSILGEMGLIKYYRMKAQYNTLSAETATLKRDNAKLAKEVRALRSDAEYIEQIARDKLGLARPGEIVYYYGAP